MTRPRDWPVLAGLRGLRRIWSVRRHEFAIAVLAAAAVVVLGGRLSLTVLPGGTASGWPGLAGSGMRERHEE